MLRQGGTGRGIEAVLDSSEDRALFGALPAEILMAAALACTGEADFRRRATPPRRAPTTKRRPGS